MDNNIKYQVATETLRNFNAIDQDHNGYLNLLEIERFATTNETIQAKMSFLTSAYDKILELENNDVRGGNNAFGISRTDLSTLKTLTSGKPDAISSLAHAQATDWGLSAGLMSFVPTSFSAFAIGSGGVLEAMVMAVPPAAILLGGFVVAAGIGYGVGRYKASNYYELKKQEVDGW